MAEADRRMKARLLAGAMNFAGNISGIVIPVTVGLIVSATGSYDLALMVVRHRGWAVRVRCWHAAPSRALIAV